MMRSKRMTRRDLLRSAAVVIGLSGAASGAVSAPCADPNAGDDALRKSLNYTESGKEEKQRCSACSFFSDPKGQCGHCAIFNGPVNVNGHCDSWAART